MSLALLTGFVWAQSLCDFLEYQMPLGYLCRNSLLLYCDVYLGWREEIEHGHLPGVPHGIKAKKKEKALMTRRGLNMNLTFDSLAIKVLPATD